MSDRLQRSKCRGGFLHKYKILKVINEGLYERCERCGDKQFFPKNTPNWKYMQYHIRQALQATDKLFKREYPNIKV